MSIVRFNVSHGTKKVSPPLRPLLTYSQDNNNMIKRYFEAKRLRPQKNCATMLDLRGREIRVGKVPEGGIPIEVGHIARVTNQGYAARQVSTEDIIQIDNGELCKVLKGGDKVNFADGKIEGQVLEILNQEIKIKFLDAGFITENSPMRVPGARIKDLPVLKHEDILDIQEIALKHKFDFVSVPGIVSAKDLQEIRQLIRGDSKVSIIAKIDSLEAVQQFQGILKYSDGVIVVRNELAFELPAEKLMIAQKWMIQQANHEAKPVFL